MKELQQVDPLNEFFDAIKSSQTRPKYKARLDMFFKYTEVPEDNLQQRASVFAAKAKQNYDWTKLHQCVHALPEGARGEEGNIRIDSGSLRQTRLD